MQSVNTTKMHKAILCQCKVCVYVRPSWKQFDNGAQTLDSHSVLKPDDLIESTCCCKYMLYPHNIHFISITRKGEHFCPRSR